MEPLREPLQEQPANPNQLSLLNEEQLRIAKMALSGKNLFITGSAGTGKTFLLRVIVEELKKIHGTSCVGVTATTGIASVSIDGVTLHSFSGFGYDLSKKPFSEENWTLTKVLVVDEISMLTSDFLDKLYKYLKKYKIQIILFGDLLQLPPVEGSCCFTSNAWDLLGLREGTVVLTKVIRQSNKEFIQVLNEIRIGQISEQSIEYLKKLELATTLRVASDRTEQVEHPNVTKLYTINRNVDAENNKRLRALTTKLFTYKAKDTIVKKKSSARTNNVPDEYRRGASTDTALSYIIRKMDKETPSEINLKVGAEVIVTKNIKDLGVVNGTRGTVTELTENIVVISVDKREVQIVRIDYDMDDFGYKMQRLQFPLRLSWALTIHRAQGMSINHLYVNLSASFANGQVYTALSRATSPENLVIHNVDDIIENNKVCSLALEYYKSIGALDET